MCVVKTISRTLVVMMRTTIVTVTKYILITAVIGFLTGICIALSMAEFPEPVELPEGFEEAMNPTQITGVN
jgi:hypothetical protein